MTTGWGGLFQHTHTVWCVQIRVRFVASCMLRGDIGRTLSAIFKRKLAGASVPASREPRHIDTFALIQVGTVFCLYVYYLTVPEMHTRSHLAQTVHDRSTCQISSPVCVWVRVSLFYENQKWEHCTALKMVWYCQCTVADFCVCCCVHSRLKVRPERYDQVLTFEDRTKHSRILKPGCI